MLEVSTATRIITPEEPCFLGGYSMRTEKSKGKLDDLKCTAMVLKVDGEPVVFCDLEILMLFREFTDEVKARLQKDFGVKPEFAALAAIHTHAAPEIRSSRLPIFDENADDSFWKGYCEFLKEQTYLTIKDCFDNGFTPVEASYKTVEVEGFYGNRTGIDKPEDKSVSVLRFTAADGSVKAAAVNIACHPTVLGADNLYVSGDLLGYISRYTKKELGVYPVMMQGASGDMSNRNYRKGHDAAELERTGEGVCSQIFSKGEFAPLTLAAPEAFSYHYEKEYETDTALFQSLKDKFEKAAELEKEYDKHKLIISQLMAVELRLKDPHVKVDFNASVLKLGELVICREPGEMFSRFGKQIKKAAKAKLAIVWGYVDDYGGYMSDEGEYGKTYESLMGRLPKGGTEEITKGLCELIESV